MKTRCDWCGDDSLYIKYHDEDWGVPVHDERLLFEMLILEGAQAGLSWITILKKRDSYKEAFDNFDVNKVADYDDDKIAELLSDPGIIRNKLKVHSTVSNAQAILKVQNEFGSFDKYLWSFTGGKTIKNTLSDMSQIPVTSTESVAMAKDLKKRGFKFCGSTICYALMQSIGIVNDHLTSCFRYNEV